MGLLTTEPAQPGLEGPERRHQRTERKANPRMWRAMGQLHPLTVVGAQGGQPQGRLRGCEVQRRHLPACRGLGFICEMKNSIYLAGLLRGAVVMCVPVCMRESVWCEAPAVYQHPAQSIIRPERQCYCPH